MGALIAKVYQDSIASRLGLAPGDQILTVNGKFLTDLIQFQWEWAGEEVQWDTLTKTGIKQHSVSKRYDEGLGIQFETPVFDGIRHCVNRCLFCFVDQMAPGCRGSLYIKDDDYRLSFLQGSFITMTNLTEEDMRRIEKERLSPLYVSVHATDPAVRDKMLGRGDQDRLTLIMDRLNKAGIEFHCQIVLCPGYNDGNVFSRTIERLSEWQGVLSVSVVPVGLTKFRQGLPVISQVQPEEATALIEWLEPTQAYYLRERGSRFVWLSDEFYVLAGRETPEAETYEGYPQWENGVGLIRSLLEEAGRYPLPITLSKEKRLILAGGIAPMKALAPLWNRLRNVQGLKVELIPLENSFFGPMVNVSGLLTGQCLIQGLRTYGLPAGAVVFLPGVMLREGEDVFIDGLTVAEVSRELNLNLVFLPPEGDKILARLFEEDSL